MTVSDDDIILDPGQIVPPPGIRGRLTQVAITRDGLAETFATAVRRPPTRSRRQPVDEDYGEGPDSARQARLKEPGRVRTARASRHGEIGSAPEVSRVCL